MSAAVATATTTAAPVVMPPASSASASAVVSTKKARSFVWVQTTPDSSTQHQAELLEIRANGFWVRWTICGKEELLPLTSVLAQELPRRRQLSTAVAATMAKQQRLTEAKIMANLDDDEKEMSLSSGKLSQARSGTSKIGEGEQFTKVLLASDTNNAIVTKKRSAGQVTNNKEHQSKEKHPKLSSSVIMEDDDDDDMLPRKQITYLQLPATLITPDKPKINPAAILSLWKLHRMAKAPAVARIAAILQQQDSKFAAAADLTANLFLFCWERQSSWHRRNNESRPQWSKSVLFQNYSFCNVYRELDRGTTYLRSQVGDLYLKRCQNDSSSSSSTTTTNKSNGNPSNSSKKKSSTKTTPLRRREWVQQILWASYCYRQVNKIEPFENFGGIPTLKQSKSFLEFVARIQDEVDDDGSRFFNTATYTTASVDPPTFQEYNFNLHRLGRDSNGWLLKSIAGRLAQCHSVSGCWRELKRLPGLSLSEYGDTVAWQVMCDLLELGCLAIKVRGMEHAIDMCYMEPKVMRTLSRSLKDKEFTEGRALEFMKTLTYYQDALFDALGGGAFLAWDGRPLAITDLIHSLGQYSKYLDIQKDLSHQVAGGGHRLLASRSYMDMSKSCRLCDTQTDEGCFCDACLCFYCSTCEGETPPEHWICKPCVGLDRLKYTD